MKITSFFIAYFTHNHTGKMLDLTNKLYIYLSIILYEPGYSIIPVCFNDV